MAFGFGGCCVDEASNPHLRRAILEVVENQLRDNTPPETRATLDRLIAEGCSRKEAIELLTVAQRTKVL